MAFGQPPKSEWEARISDAAARIEAELRQAARTIEDEVVPEVRRHGSSALRTLAAKLDKLAVHLDDAHRDAARQQASTPPPSATAPDSRYPREAYDEPGTKDGI